MFVFLVLGGVIAALFYYLAIRPMNYWKNHGVAQGDPLWLVGDSFKVVIRTESFAEFDQRIYSRYKHLRYSGAYQLTSPMLVLHDPELIKQITVKDFDHFLDHQTFVPDNADLLWSKNLFALRGQKWREMRPILSPSFTTSKMRTIFVLMCESVENFVKHFSKESKRDTIDVEMREVLGRLANDIIATTAFGIKVDSLTNPDNEFYQMGRDITNLSGILVNIKFLLFMVIPKFFEFFEIGMFSKAARKFFTSTITETIKVREEKKLVRPDMIHLLMEARKGKVKQEENVSIDTGFATVQEAGAEKANGTVEPTAITDLDIAAQAMIFLFGGFDSVTNTMSFLSYELATHTDIQERLREEIRETDRACNGKITYEALMQMKYMDMVVSEVLRKWPNAVATDRVCTKAYTIEPKNPGERPVHLKPGQVVWIPMFGIHHDPEYYPEPEKFDPERFNDENKSKIVPYTYYPFGLGPRNCIASRFALMEIKLVFHHLLLNFELVPTEKTPIPPVISRKTFTLLIEGGFHVGLRQIRQKDD